MVKYHWELWKECHIADPRKGGGYHCHLWDRWGRRTRFITILKTERGVNFVYIQRHNESYESNEIPEGTTTMLKIGLKTIEKLEKISPEGRMVHSEAKSALIYPKLDSEKYFKILLL